MKKVVVTGPTGLIGSALIKKLLKENCIVFAIIHKDSLRLSEIPKNKNVNIIYKDISAIKDVPVLIGEKCDIFYHLAWLGTGDNHNRMNMYLQNNNIRYSLDAVEVAKSLECDVFIGCGSQAEYGIGNGVISVEREEKPVSGYGMAKLCAGQMTRAMCKQYGIRHIWPRIVSVYGSNDASKTLISIVINKLLSGEKPSLTKCEQIWDYLYCGDAADALWAMAKNGRDGAVYVLGSGKPVVLKDCVEFIHKEINPNINIGYGDIPYYPDQVMHMEADISVLKDDTGWQPSTSFEDGIKETIANMKKLRR